MNHSISATPLLPREKIEARGVESITTAELLSVILGNGSGNIPVQLLVKKISEKLLEKKNLQLRDLTEIKGLGLAKSCQILAAIELVERLRPSGFPVIDSLPKVLHQVGELRYALREQVVCLYLNARMQLVLKETLAVGSVNQSIISPRDIFSAVKYHPISYVILIHNHPSGIAFPSSEDIAFTERTFEAGRILGIELLDHIIVAKEEHYSCKEQRILPE